MDKKMETTIMGYTGFSVWGSGVWGLVPGVGFPGRWGGWQNI